MKSEPTSLARRLKKLARSEIGRYLFFGGLTTIVNNLVYWLTESVVGRDFWLISEVSSIGLSILFAYIVNRRYVFYSKNPVWPEIAYFFASRLVISFVFEVIVFYLIHDVWGFTNDFIPNLPYAKLIGQVIVVVANYIFSKFALFKPLTSSEKELPDHDTN